MARSGRQQDRGLAAEVQQGLHRLPLVPARGQRGEDELVVGLPGGDVQPVEELQVEPTGHPEDHADQPGLAAGQQSCAGVGAVTDLGRGLEDPLPGLRRRSVRAPRMTRDTSERDIPVRAATSSSVGRLPAPAPVCSTSPPLRPREYVRTKS